jgi:hypothetical protein
MGACTTHTHFLSEDDSSYSTLHVLNVTTSVLNFICYQSNEVEKIQNSLLTFLLNLFEIGQNPKN